MEKNGWSDHMLKRKNVFILILIACLLAGVFYLFAATGFNNFTVYQFPPQSSTQMMGYMLKTTGNKIILIDGGTHSDSDYLKEQIKNAGGHVDLWIITHPHSDHIDAVTDVLLDKDIRVDLLYGSLPDRSFIEQYEPAYLPSFDDFNKAIQGSKAYKDININDTISIDGLKITFLAINNPELVSNPLNNSSVVFKVSSSSKSILFLGDAGVDEGNKIMKAYPREILKSDYVQMAHHGQAGVSKEFYKLVDPDYCLWPTPKWLWDNDNGGGYNSGSWDTINVRKWMDEIGVKENYVSYNGLIIIK